MYRVLRDNDVGREAELHEDFVLIEGNRKR